MKISFYYDCVCPYAYLASTRIEALAARAGAAVEWKPILLGGVFRALYKTGNLGGKAAEVRLASLAASPDVPAEAMPPAKARLNLLDMQRYAQLHGVTLRLHPQHPRRTVDAMRMCLAAGGDERVRLTHALYRRYFVENRDLSDRAVLADAAAEIGRPDLVREIDAHKDTLRAATDEAVQRGVFGVPTFIVDGERLYWGQDRMHLFLPETIGEASGASRGAPRRAVPGEDARSIDIPPGGGGEVEFFYDFSSPYSYLGSTQIERVARAHGATVRWRPFLLGALFKEIGTPTVPLLSFAAPKRRYYEKDVLDWAAHWGVPFRWPSRFPMRTVTALRLALAVDEAARPALSHALYRAYWVDDRDLSDPAVLGGVAAEVGVDPGALDRAQSDPALKDALKAATDQALAAGVCGAPSFLVGDELFWGQDRLPLVARALSGELAKR
jgi:2-hydroxychromene-2-carboxylate isomerase